MKPIKPTYEKRLSTLPAPALAGVVRERTVRSAIAEIENCRYDGAKMIDLHLSCLETDDLDSLRSIISASRLPILALNYNHGYSWEEKGLSEEARIESLLRAAAAGAAGIDMQGYTFDVASKTAFHGDGGLPFTQNAPKEVVTDAAVIEKQCELIKRVHAMGAEVLLSCHPGIFMTCDEIVSLALFLEKRNPDIIKIVTAGVDTEEDLFECFRTMTVLKRELKTPVSYHANGKAASLSRIINPVLGGQIVFCVDRFNEGSTIGQLDLKTAKAAIENIKKIM